MLALINKEMFFFFASLSPRQLIKLRSPMLHIVCVLVHVRDIAGAPFGPNAVGRACTSILLAMIPRTVSRTQWTRTTERYLVVKNVVGSPSTCDFTKSKKGSVCAAPIDRGLET
uniref:Uncharacterized protein n=1 Tax=Pseudo-nitzschia australis TaxID=44445 RepID=A0A7S4EJH5_9STRA